MSHCTENHNMDLTAWYKSQKLIILGKHYFVIHYIFWSKSEAIWDVMLSHHFMITLKYLFNIRLHIIIISRGRQPPSWLLDEDCLVERVGGQVFLLDHKIVANEHFVNLQGSSFSLIFLSKILLFEKRTYTKDSSWIGMVLYFSVPKRRKHLVFTFAKDKK